MRTNDEIYAIAKNSALLPLALQIALGADMRSAVKEEIRKTLQEYKQLKNVTTEVEALELALSKI